MGAGVVAAVVVTVLLNAAKEMSMIKLYGFNGMPSDAPLRNPSSTKVLFENVSPDIPTQNAPRP